MYGYIYKTTNLLNGKIYIGQKKSNVFRPDYYGSGVIINRAIEKYGKENFKIEIVEWCKNRDDLCEREIFHIANEKSLYGFGKGYNITPGGEYGDSFTHHPDKEEIRKRMSIANTGRKHTEEWKKKASIRMSGKNNPMYGVPSPNKGKKASLETIEKLRKINRGRKYTEEQKKKMRKKYNETVKNRTPEKQKEIHERMSKASKKRLVDYEHPQNKKVYVYENDILVNEFKNSVYCRNYYYDNYGLPKKTMLHNLRNDKPILPDNPQGIRKDLYNIRKQFKDYDFTHIKR